jgi:hypothetical protein
MDPGIRCGDGWSDDSSERSRCGVITAAERRGPIRRDRHCLEYSERLKQPGVTDFVKHRAGAQLHREARPAACAAAGRRCRCGRVWRVRRRSGAWPSAGRTRSSASSAAAPGAWPLSGVARRGAGPAGSPAAEPSRPTRTRPALTAGIPGSLTGANPSPGKTNRSSSACVGSASNWAVPSGLLIGQEPGRHTPITGPDWRSSCR